MPGIKTFVVSTCLALAAGFAPAAPTRAAMQATPALTQARVMRDVAYGGDPRQRFDVYVPADVRGAPTIFIVHGGGWRTGDKTNAQVVDAKIARWLPKGVIVVSSNYRLLPDADPLAQARDVARAVAAAQRTVQLLGGDPARFVLMGHSAGAHLVSLLAASPQMLRAAGARPPLGVVSLDSAAMDVVALMRSPHARLYDDAFGSDPRAWLVVSPLQALQQAPVPILAVCSSLRRESCPANDAFVHKVVSLGGRGELLPEPLSHRQINARLGRDNDYTRSVERFLRTLGVIAR